MNNKLLNLDILKILTFNSLSIKSKLANSLMLLVPAVFFAVSLLKIYSPNQSVQLFWYAVVLSLVISIYSIFVFIKKITDLAPIMLAVSSVYFAIFTGAVMYKYAFPSIPDIATRFEPQMEFVYAKGLTENQNQDLSFSEVNKNLVVTYYPKLTSLKIEKNFEEVLDQVKKTLESFENMQPTYVNDSEGNIELVQTGYIFGLQSDVLIQVRPESEQVTSIDMRIRSRDNMADFGANSKTIITFFYELQKQLGLITEKKK